MQFNQLKIQHFIKQAIHDLKFNNMTPVQESVIPLALEGKNLIVQSQTGSGKTHAFMIPIVEAIDPTLSQVQAVITAPSRELADQLYEVANQLVKDAPETISIVKYVGGTDKKRQMDKLGPKSQPHIVIGTPGRILDLMKENALWVQTSKMFVVDEADMTLDMGFLSSVDEIASRMPEALQMMVFSATIPQQLEIFLNKYMRAPQRIMIDNNYAISDTVKNYLIATKGRDRKELTYELLTMGHPFLALIFANTKQYTDELTQFLMEKGLKVAKIHGDIDSRERKRVMKQIRQLEYQYVVASDLAARGIDIPGTSMVINTELPSDLEFFVHRVGRTGRNGHEGVAYTLLTPDDDSAVSQLESKGIDFIHAELKQGQVVETHSRNRRKERKHTDKSELPEVTRVVNQAKKKKVKPGYKQKMKRQIKEIKKKQARK